MKVQLCILILFFFFGPFCLLGQEVPPNDTLISPFNGFQRLPDVIYHFKGDKFESGDWAFASGYYEDGVKVGIWELTDRKGNIIGYRYYHDDNDFIEIDLKCGKVSSIVRFLHTVDENDSLKGIVVFPEILSFKRNGKFQKRYGLFGK